MKRAAVEAQSGSAGDNDRRRLGGAALFCFLRRGLLPRLLLARIFSDDASGLMDGTQVRLNGIPIGYLETQKLTNSRDLMRKVELDLKVRNAYLDQNPGGFGGGPCIGQSAWAIFTSRSTAEKARARFSPARSCEPHRRRTSAK